MALFLSQDTYVQMSMKLLNTIRPDVGNHIGFAKLGKLGFIFLLYFCSNYSMVYSERSIKLHLCFTQLSRQDYSYGFIITSMCSKMYATTDQNDLSLISFGGKMLAWAIMNYHLGSISFLGVCHFEQPGNSCWLCNQATLSAFLSIFFSLLNQQENVKPLGICIY